MKETDLKIKAREWAYLYFAALPNSIKESILNDSKGFEREYMIKVNEIDDALEYDIRYIISS